MNVDTSQATASYTRTKMMAKPPQIRMLYERWFNPLKNRDIRLLELGVYQGDSLMLYRDYFKNGMMVGLDMNPVHISDPTNRIRVYQGYQQDTALLDLIGRQEAPEGFDIIIDDCSHIGELTRISFWHLFQNHLKPGGIFAIEDVNSAYVASWPDGKSYKPRPYPIKSAASSALLPTGWRALQLQVLSRGVGLAKRLLPRRAAQFFLRSDQLRGLPLAVATKRYGYRKKIPSHTYGMVGFVKELMDICCLGEKSGNSTIGEMHVYENLVIIVKSSPAD